MVRNGLQRIGRIPVEIVITLAFVAFTILVSAATGLPIVAPGSRSASFVGVHYLYPLFGIALWALLVTVHGKQPLGRTFLIALPCYAAVLFCHFNLKLWIGHVNPVLWDAQYWAIDRAVAPLVTGSMQLRLALAPVIPLDSNFYMTGFITMFYVAFAVHALQSKDVFRELVLATIILQILGSLTYFLAPALGPFLYEAGVEPPAAASQARMYALWLANQAGGAEWLAANGSTHFTAGLAAMPSLHAGGSLLFVIFAWRHARFLLPVMVPIFAFITITAIANRWHYVIDLPFGMMIAFAAAWLARRSLAGAHIAEDDAAHGALAPSPAPALALTPRSAA